MKIIDLLNKIANGEEVPHFIIDEQEYYVGANGFLTEFFGEDVEWKLDKKWLNEQVQILEDKEEFEDIEELYNCLAETDNEIEKILIQNINDLSEKINQLTRNQKKIIDYINKGDSNDC